MSEAVSILSALKGALHVHTTCSDGRLTPIEAIEVYRALGFDFVALTDHDFLMGPDAYAGVPDEIGGTIVFKGVERTVFAHGYVHVNCIFGGAETLHVFNHPAEYDFTVARTIACIKEVARVLPIHAVEVSAKGYYTPEYDVDAIPYPKVASDDSHTREGCGRAWVEVPCERERDAILRAIKEGRARPCCQWTASRAAWRESGPSCDNGLSEHERERAKAR